MLHEYKSLAFEQTKSLILDYKSGGAMIMMLVLFAFRTCLRSVIKPEPKCRTSKKKVSNESHVKSYEFSSFEAGLNGPTLPNSGSDLRTLV